MKIRVMNTRMTWAIFVAVLLGAIRAEAQTQTAPSAQRQSFEVASIRLSSPNEDRYTAISPINSAHFTATRASFVLLIELAYGVQESEIVGKPSWSDSAYYDVSAKPEGDHGVSYEQFKPMMQQLLAERLRLVVHRETRMMKGYALVVAKGGPKLSAAPAEEKAGQLYILPDGIRASSIGMDGLASMLTRVTGRPTVDKTGLKGNYRINLNYAPAGATDSSAPSVYTALEEQLGLKLETTEVPVNMLVIDHVDREPVEN